ncbi:BON domain-containing protein [Thiorhodococcus minor]|uniref:BON domain-containing protein n=1 Tax=Thiorhodococcus minor TaxID=57489 RepID=A0A6M0JV37_9GAMM|nr:BON domain-containing protein [Thiorhodococcus minor]NEV61396.1 BON domain-containing protein [Thiorhodococcus minor]
MRHPQRRIAAILAALAISGSTLAGSPERAEGTSSKMQDLMTEARINTAYALNEHLSPFRIDVDARGNRLILEGEVDNEAQRMLAERLAVDMSGIDVVDNRLRVAPRVEDDTARKLFDFVQDANTTARVEMQLLWNETTSGLDIEVETEGKQVTLTGNVSTEKERQLAERIAQHTQGVDSVENKLQVAPEDTLSAQANQVAQEAAKAVSDTWITARITASLRFNKAIDHSRIHVTTQDGVVTLRGRVSTAQERDEVTAIASGIAGVKKVIDALEVPRSA